MPSPALIVPAIIMILLFVADCAGPSRTGRSPGKAFLSGSAHTPGSASPRSAVQPPSTLSLSPAPALPSWARLPARRRALRKLGILPGEVKLAIGGRTLHFDIGAFQHAFQLGPIRWSAGKAARIAVRLEGDRMWLRGSARLKQFAFPLPRGTKLYTAPSGPEVAVALAPLLVSVEARRGRWARLKVRRGFRGVTGIEETPVLWAPLSALSARRRAAPVAPSWSGPAGRKIRVKTSAACPVALHDRPGGKGFYKLKPQSMVDETDTLHIVGRSGSWVRLWYRARPGRLALSGWARRSQVDRAGRCKALPGLGALGSLVGSALSPRAAKPWHTNRVALPLYLAPDRQNPVAVGMLKAFKGKFKGMAPRPLDKGGDVFLIPAGKGMPPYGPYAAAYFLEKRRLPRGTLLSMRQGGPPAAVQLITSSIFSETACTILGRRRGWTRVRCPIGRGQYMKLWVQPGALNRSSGKLPLGWEEPKVKAVKIGDSGNCRFKMHEAPGGPITRSITLCRRWGKLEAPETVKVLRRRGKWVLVWFRRGVFHPVAFRGWVRAGVLKNLAHCPCRGDGRR